MIKLPSPPPPPGPPNSDYQNAFNIAYYLSRRPELQPFFFNRPGALTGVELTEPQREQLANDLYAEKIDFDEEIDFRGEDPYSDMYGRKVLYGYERVPVGTGTTTQPDEVVTKQNLIGPPIPGKYLLVSIDIKDFPPYKA